MELLISGFNPDLSEKESVSIETEKHVVQNIISSTSSDETSEEEFEDAVENPEKHISTEILETKCEDIEKNVVSLKLDENVDHNTNIQKEENNDSIYNNTLNFDNLLESKYNDNASDIFSIGSVSTTSTIAPSVIHSRVKKALEKQKKMMAKQRCLAKGEASAIARKRKENKDIIKEYYSCSIWE